MSAGLEEHRPGGSDGSLVRTFVGSWLRHLGGWVATAAFVQLLGDAGVSSASARTNISRLKSKGLLEPHTVGDVPGYRLSDDAHPMLARGDRRIYEHRQMQDGDPWMVVAFTVPESQRGLRHRLRSHLTWLGCGAVAPGIWIGPGHLLDETRDVLSEVGLLRYTTLFSTGTPLVVGELRDAVARWWDLPALDARYTVFLSAHEPVAARWRADGDPDRPDAEHRAYRDHLRAVDDWRSIPYLDPSLPPGCLPPGWRGHDGVALFAELHDRLSGPASRHVRRRVQAVGGGQRRAQTATTDAGRAGLARST